MAGTILPRAVVVTRKSEYERLIEEHGTREQARFFLETRGQSIEEIEAEHRGFLDGLEMISQAIPVKWRRSRVERADLDRFLFEPDDLVIAVGQDGLVANTAKYLDGQIVVGFNANPKRNDGVLVPHGLRHAKHVIAAAHRREGAIEERTMVEAKLDDGQRLLALNELYLGHRTHQSSRYRLGCAGKEERQSSSGVIVSTGTGSTGWARSIHRERHTGLALPEPAEKAIVFFVREAFPSRATGVSITSGRLNTNEELALISEMNADGVIFGDGIEEDRIDLRFGQRAVVRIAKEKLALFRG